MKMKILVVMFVMFAVTAVAEAPGIDTARGVLDLVYRIDDNGAIYDEKGGLKGWIQGDTVYDANWGPRYMVGVRGALREIDSRQ